MEVTSKRGMIYKTKYDLIAYICVGATLLIGVGTWILMR